MKRLLALAASPRTTWTLLGGAVLLGLWALASERDQVAAAVAALDAYSLLGAFAAGIAVIATSAMIWRAVLSDLGSTPPWTPSAEIFLLGQVGKYLPGSLWPMVMQAQLGAKYGLARRRVLASSMITLLVSVAAAAATMVLTLPLLPDLDGGTRWLGLLIVPIVVLLHPRVMVRVLDRLFALLGRPALGTTTTVRGTALAFGWALLTWAWSGVLLLVLAHPLGLELSLDSFVLCVGAYVTAWLIGLLVVIAPAGAGAREGALVLLLGTAMPRGSALVVALLARVVLTVLDLALAGLAVLAARRAGVGVVDPNED